jgi:addiction module HigA family antidote
MLKEEFIVPGGLTQRALAKRLGWTVARLSELVNGKRGVTADAALDLADVLGTSPEVWLNLQMYFDLHRAEKRRRAS